MCCEKKNNVKSGTSKISNHKISFEYTNKPFTVLYKYGKKFFDIGNECSEIIYT
jgi:hypothetical protein